MTTKTITVQRWYHSPEMWLNIVSGVGSLATLATAQLGLLGLAGPTLFTVTLSLTMITNAANIAVKFILPSIIASKKTISAIAEMPNTATVETATANNAGTVATVELNPAGR